MRHADEAGHGDGQAAGGPEPGPAGGDRRPARPPHGDRGLHGRAVQRTDARRAVSLISGLYQGYMISIDGLSSTYIIVAPSLL